MCHYVRLVEVEGRKYIQQVSYEGEVLYELPFEEPELREPEPATITVKARKVGKSR